MMKGVAAEYHKASELLASGLLASGRESKHIQQDCAQEAEKGDSAGVGLVALPAFD